MGSKSLKLRQNPSRVAAKSQGPRLASFTDLPPLGRSLANRQPATLSDSLIPSDPYPRGPGVRLSEKSQAMSIIDNLIRPIGLPGLRSNLRPIPMVPFFFFLDARRRPMGDASSAFLPFSDDERVRERKEEGRIGIEEMNPSIACIYRLCCPAKGRNGLHSAISCSATSC